MKRLIDPTRFPTSLIIFTSCVFASTGCGDISDAERREGELNITIYGEEFVEEGIPAEEMQDGWSVSFGHFAVSLSEVKIGDVELAPKGEFELTRDTAGAGQTVTTVRLPVGEYTRPSFSVTRVSLSGVATRGDATKTFDWVFDQETHYDACESVTRVTDEAPATLQITMHADHFFYDSLVSEEPQVVFQALADADADEDGAITRAELEATGVGRYDPGSSADVEDLWAWLNAQSQTLAHVNGEGHCDSHAH